MLPKKNRVKRDQFELMLAKGSLYHGPFFSVRMKKNTKREPFSFAVVVSKKIAKTAVGRNLLKRRVRAVIEERFRSRMDEPLSLIFFMKKEAASLPFSDLKKQIMSYTYSL
jgi:ribonuclease P protein component